MLVHLVTEVSRRELTVNKERDAIISALLVVHGSGGRQPDDSQDTGERLDGEHIDGRKDK